jgi:hypothetical protein
MGWRPRNLLERAPFARWQMGGDEDRRHELVTLLILVFFVFASDRVSTGKASPLLTQPSFAASSRASPANTNGGNDKSSRSTSRSFAASAYSGICTTGFMRHLSGVHRPFILYFSTLLPHANRDAFRPGHPYDHQFARANRLRTCHARPHGKPASHIKFVAST